MCYPEYCKRDCSLQVLVVGSFVLILLWDNLSKCKALPCKDIPCTSYNLKLVFSKATGLQSSWTAFSKRVIKQSKTIACCTGVCAISGRTLGLTIVLKTMAKVFNLIFDSIVFVLNMQ